MKNFKLPLLLLVLLTFAYCTTEPDSSSSIPIIPAPGPTAPIVATVPVSAITFTTAVTGGEIATDGGAPILDKGIVWSLNQNPTTNLTTKKSEGSGSDSFTSAITGLETNKTYYVRAYARNGKGLSYGNQETFKTLIDSNLLPRVTTLMPSIITTNSASTGGTVTSAGIANVTARGIVWGLNPEPTITVNLGLSTSGVGLGNFATNLTNLLPNVTYNVRAYATSSYGTNYGAIFTFTTNALLYTNGSGVTDIDGTNYSSVILNNQQWTTKNLSVTKYKNGDPIPQVQNDAQWAALTTGAWCYYSNVTANGTVYGKLYNWYAVNDPRGIAPNGWHVSTNDEWLSLTDFLGGNQLAGGLLKQAGLTRWQTPNTGAINSSGITALPGGFRMANGTSSDLTTKGYWWTSDSFNQVNAYCTGMFHDTKTITRAPIDKRQGFSVRLVKN